MPPTTMPDAATTQATKQSSSRQRERAANAVPRATGSRTVVYEFDGRLALTESDQPGHSMHDDAPRYVDPLLDAFLPAEAPGR